MQTKICPRCKAKVPANAKFCTNCGYKFPDNPVPKKTVNSNPNPTQPRQQSQTYQNDLNKQRSINKYQEGLNQKDTASAINYYKAAITLDPKNYSAWDHLGCKYENLKNYPKAINLYKKIANATHSDNFYNKLGVAYDDNGQAYSAIKYYQKAISINNQKALYFYNTASEYKDINNYPQAIKYYKRAAEINPKNPNYWDWLGYLSMLTHDNQNAINYYQKAITLNNSKPFYFARMGHIYYNANQFKASIKYFQKAIDMDPKNQSNNGYQEWIEKDEQALAHQSQDNINAKRNSHFYLNKLNRLVGLNHVKKQLKRYITQIKYDKAKANRKDKGYHGVIHLIFEGNSGTGKSTVAELFYGILKQEKIIKSKHCVTVNASKFNHNSISKAMNGVLIIDNVHPYFNANYPNQENVSIMDDLLSSAEKYKNHLVIILCVRNSNIKTLLKANPKLKSRFPTVIHFPDYTQSECQQILLNFIQAGNLSIDSNQTKYQLLSDLNQYIKLTVLNQTNFSNAITVRNLYDELRINVINRLKKTYSDSELKQLKANHKLVNVININDVKITFKHYNIPLNTHGNDALKKLHNLIGLDNVKKQIKEYINNAKISQATNYNQQPEMHLIFEGNPGTGKTTVARLLAKALYEGHVIPTEKLIEVQGLDLMPKIYGAARAKVQQVVKEALGGVLFIDEAYALNEHHGNNSNAIADEAIAALVAAVENHRNDLVVIMAGYTQPMEKFLHNTNPGLISRFPTKIIFHDYSGSECFKILKYMMNHKHLILSQEKDIDTILLQYVKKAVSLRQGLSKDTFGNARYVRSILQKLILTKNDRLNHLPKDQLNKMEQNNSQELNTITLSDIKKTFKGIGIDRHQRHSALDKLNSLIGLDNVKGIMKQYINNAKIEHLLHINTQSEMHMVFEGNPGTGKTTVARLFAQALYEGHVIKSYKVKEVQGSDLMAGYVGQTKGRTRRIVHDALGGVLFIDEAYTLGGNSNDGNSFAQEAVAELVADIEKYRNDLVVILAGYTIPMERFLKNTNPGLSSRFSTKVHFPDYNDDDCCKILHYMMKTYNIKLSDEDNIGQILDLDVKNCVSADRKATGTRFGNARFIRTLLRQIIFAKNNRLAKLPEDKLMQIYHSKPSQLNTVKLIDLRHVFNN